MKTINIILFMFIIIGQQSVFAEAKYSFKKISEKEFEAEFNDGEKKLRKL